MKFGLAVFELCERTDRQADKMTNRHSHHNTWQPYRDKVASAYAVCCVAAKRCYLLVGINSLSSALRGWPCRAVAPSIAGRLINAMSAESPPASAYSADLVYRSLFLEASGFNETDSENGKRSMH